MGDNQTFTGEYTQEHLDQMYREVQFAQADLAVAVEINEGLEDELKFQREKAQRAYLNWIDAKSQVEDLRKQLAETNQALKDLAFDYCESQKQLTASRLEIKKLQGLLKRAEALLGAYTEGAH